mmetsp:Transcript_30116/g.50368  ORF Transcript_30116/g.50368 Transcript_30116/m.50368 type:complete len:574 (-) Transcript_30116:158-1879(-)
MNLGQLTRTWRAKIAISWFFLVTGASLGNWAAILPFVKDEQDLSNGTLGLVLLAAIGGALIALPIVTYFNGKFGTGPSTTISSLISFALSPIIGLRHNIVATIIGIFLLGFSIGCVDVSVNAQAVLFEKMTRKPHLGLFQGTFAIGGFIGAIIGGIIMEQDGTNVLQELSIVASIFILPGILLGFWLFSNTEEKQILHNGLVDYEQQQYAKFGNDWNNNTATNAAINGNPHNDGADQLNPLLGPMSGPEEYSLHSGVNDDNIDGSSFTGSGVDTIVDNSNRSTSGSYLSYNDVATAMEAQAASVIVSNSSQDKNNNASPQLADWQVYEVQEFESTSAFTWLEDCYISYKKQIPVLQLAFISFLSFFGEGAVSDWSAIYFTDELNSSPLISTFGFAGFQAMLAIGGYISDYSVLYIGRRRLLALSGVIASVGLGIVVAAPVLLGDVGDEQNMWTQIVSVIGFSVTGLGVSSIGPSVISLAGSEAVSRGAGMKSAECIAYVTSVGYLGIMLSPPLLGGVAALLHSVRWSFAVAVGFLLPITVVTMCMKRSIFESYKLSLQREQERQDEEEDSVIQ